MPTYLYECENCGRFEEFQKITDESLGECPECGASVKRIIGAPGIIFKGSGFYSTDVKSSSNINKNSKNNTTDDVKTEKVDKTDKKEAKKDNKEIAS